MGEAVKKLKECIENEFNFRFDVLYPVSFGSMGSEAVLVESSEVLMAEPSEKMLVGSSKGVKDEFFKVLQAPFEFLWVKSFGEGKEDMEEYVREAWAFVFKNWIPVLLECGGKKLLIRPFSQLQDCLDLLVS